MAETLSLVTNLPASPKDIYNAWLDNQAHTDFTGGAADISAKIGGKFSAWDGYIWGNTLILEPYRRIIQSWRTTDFPEGAADSQIEIILEPAGDGSQFTLIHTNIPDGQAGEYRKGWEDYYFTPMKSYFSGNK